MSSTEIKCVIGLLCKQLNLLLNANIKPEYFRLAKFDLSEENVVPKLWRTLSLLTRNEDNTDMALVKDYMRSINYSSLFFYSLPEDLSVGSRELLLAICFIIAKDLQNLIMKAIEKSPFGESSSFVDENNIPFVRKPEIPNLSDEKGVNNFLKWIEGRIQQNQKMTNEYEAQTTKMYDKLNKSLNISTINKLSLNTVMALSNKKYCNEFLEKCSSILELLQCYQDWSRKENIFWKWMKYAVDSMSGIVVISLNLIQVEEFLQSYYSSERYRFISELLHLLYSSQIPNEEYIAFDRHISKTGHRIG